jgi:hypothetical protein
MRGARPSLHGQSNIVRRARSRSTDNAGGRVVAMQSRRQPLEQKSTANATAVLVRGPGQHSSPLPGVLPHRHGQAVVAR